MVKDFKISDKGINLIKKFEGCRLKAYKCSAGVWTIGYGHTAYVKEGQKITQEKAEEYLKSDLARFENCINKHVHVDINQNQFDALCSFVFNIGCNAFQSSTLLRTLNQGKFKEAAEQFQKWVYSGKKVLEGLKKRRLAEYNLFIS